MSDKTYEVFVHMARDYQSVVGGRGPKQQQQGIVLPRVQRLVRKEVRKLIGGTERRMKRAIGVEVEDEDEEEIEDEDETEAEDGMDESEEEVVKKVEQKAVVPMEEQEAPSEQVKEEAKPNIKSEYDAIEKQLTREERSGRSRENDCQSESPGRA